MKRVAIQSSLAFFVLTLAIALMGVSIPGVQAAQPLSLSTATDILRVGRVVKDLKVIVGHRDDQGRQHTFDRFSPTRLRIEGDTILIEGSVRESSVGETVDLMIRLKAAQSTSAPRPNSSEAWWFEDEDRINSMH